MRILVGAANGMPSFRDGMAMWWERCRGEMRRENSHRGRLVAERCKGSFDCADSFAERMNPLRSGRQVVRAV